MKLRNLLIIAVLSAFAFTSCEDNKKKEQEEKEKMEMQRVEAEKEAERQAEMKAEEERMQMESNSVAAKAMATAELSTLVKALQAGELAQMMKEDKGPYTVFAPTNAAFDKLPKGTLDNLLKEENKEKLQSVLKYHVVNDKITAEKLTQWIKDNNGTYKFKTVEGAELTAMMSGDKVVLKDGNGKTANIVTADVDASNGVVHLIDAVIMKKG
jgi:uncharacterized surface protein with fasciclin (FAS1) repeats